jgi:hypothetical protein
VKAVPKVVMPGLVPGIQPTFDGLEWLPLLLDGRDKPGHDDGG